MSNGNIPLGENIDGDYRSELSVITRNAGITASGFLILNLFSFISNAMITRYLGADDYGLLVLATRIFDFVLILSSLGFATTIVRHVAYFFARNDHEKVKGTISYSLQVVLTVSIVILTLFFVLSPYISDRVFGRAEISPLLRIVLLSLPFSLISMVYLSALNGLKQIKSAVIIKNFITPAVFTLMVGIVILFNWGLRGLLWIYIFVGIFGAFLAFRSVGKAYLNQKKNIKPIAEKKKLWNFSYPLLFIQVINNIIGLLPIFIIGYYMSNVDVGIFNVSLKIAVIVSFSLNAFSMIFSPVMAELFSVNNHHMISRLYKTVTKWTFSFSLVVFFIILLFPGTLLGIFGPEFAGGVNILLFIAAGELINSGAGLVGSLILMSGRPKVILFNSIFKFLFLIALCLFLIPAYGLAGAGFSVAVSQASINLIRLAELYYFEKIHPFKRSYYKPLLSASISYLLTYLTIKGLEFNPYVELVFGTTLFIFLFMLLNWMLKLDEEDKFVIQKFTNYLRK